MLRRLPKLIDEPLALLTTTVLKGPFALRPLVAAGRRMC